ncbi:CaiB/BaiF CoA transferase family protein [Geodermatophilus ruber]|uniref:CoA-transferase family III n=1 Tax=Geodermatophilus ruber TaxID=504800 RepID=A0A1I4AA91_9ACTN|nr:CoA transferase [Geodermatophilus ruber]SFK53007.1 CoA-transferase family III [Geodermatophilus ruber]
MTGSAGDRPLAGMVVIDLTNALAGPYATLLLAGLGARVVKVENPSRGGDPARNNSPYLSDGRLSVRRQAPEDMSVSMLVRGRNKESLTLDLRTDEGREVLADLVRSADILVENYSAGVTARLGIDHAWARQLNPRLVYTSISGFGAGGGPGTGKAMDTIIQALSGVMMTSGAPGEPPVRLGLPVADLLAPLYAVIGTVAAVLQAERTGVGQHVDVSMLGALTSLVACEPFDAFEQIGLPLRTGATVPRLAPFGTFEAKDGWFALCAPVDPLAHGLLRAIGREDLVEDPRFAGRDGRVAHADELHGLIAAWSADRSLAEVLSALDAAGAPAAEVRDPSSAVRDPLVLARGEVVRLTEATGPDVVELYGTGIPIVMSGSGTTLDRPAPQLGEHTRSVLRELCGYPEERIDALAEGGVV